MTKLGIRYYDPTLGRFTQPDPTGQDPHYTYAANNPVNYTDPTGAVSVGVEVEACLGAFVIGVARGSMTAGFNFTTGRFFVDPAFQAGIGGGVAGKISASFNVSGTAPAAYSFFKACIPVYGPVGINLSIQVPLRGVAGDPSVSVGACAGAGFVTGQGFGG